ncbi:hypothetical protein I7I53_03293 [Histoplasma capsulatum var. duboisii H88]|uniref:Uncharacterized protein n=1 Tax=Ajellomyces capsulatus (strain H88) TaxID=544711 RepID=A0A8A1LSM5_AJEC8|nr:hypothetical protein I7I53_03293 [Histoplasma capsulatum var. duboisii H88]
MCLEFKIPSKLFLRFPHHSSCLCWYTPVFSFITHLCMLVLKLIQRLGSFFEPYDYPLHTQDEYELVDNLTKWELVHQSLNVTIKHDQRLAFWLRLGNGGARRNIETIAKDIGTPP